MHERSCLWKPFCSERVNESQKLLKSEKKYFYLPFSQFEPVWVRKTFIQSYLRFSDCLLTGWLTANYEYYGSNRDNLLLPSQT